MAETLTESAVDAVLKRLPNWKPMGWHSTEEIYEGFRFSNFEAAWEFARKVVQAVQGREHHLSLQLGYSSPDTAVVGVRFGSGGRITQDDIDLAHRVEALLDDRVEQEGPPA